MSCTGDGDDYRLAFAKASMIWTTIGETCLMCFNRTSEGTVRIAISGKSGCGNTTISRRVAKKIGHRCVNYTFKNLADELGISVEQLSEMAAADPDWDRRLDDQQIEMSAGDDVVLGSRLAIWLMPEPDLRVYLRGTIETRARRIHERLVREGQSSIDYASVLAHTIERDAQDHSRFLRVHGIDNDLFGFADLVLETDHMEIEEEVRCIIEKCVGLRDT
jgi:CMP/dCMP kinase